MQICASANYSIVIHPVILSAVSADSDNYNKNIVKLDMLRQHKPPPIRRIRISDFGLPVRTMIRIATKIVSLGP